MKNLLYYLLLMLLMFGCSKQTTVGIQRNPILKFGDSSLSWSANTYYFGLPSQIVAYPSDTTQSGKLYSRLTLQAVGQSNKGQTLQFILMFDVADPANLLGTYTTRYNSARGLAQVQIFNLSNNNLASYALKVKDSTAMLVIQRQSSSERLIAGTFKMTLYNTRDTLQTINITNGVLTDIHY